MLSLWWYARYNVRGCQTAATAIILHHPADQTNHIVDVTATHGGNGLAARIIFLALILSQSASSGVFIARYRPEKLCQSLDRISLNLAEATIEKFLKECKG